MIKETKKERKLGEGERPGACAIKLSTAITFCGKLVSLSASPIFLEVVFKPCATRP
jgi:hypothetical protein